MVNAWAPQKRHLIFGGTVVDVNHEMLALRFRQVELTVDATEEELKRVFRLLNDPRIAPLVRGDLVLRSHNTFADIFQSWEKSEFGFRFFVRHDQRGLIGFVWEYARNLSCGSSRISLVLSPDVIGKGYGAFAAALMTGYVFDTVRIDGIYFDVFGFNSHVLQQFRSLSRYLGHPIQEGFVPKYKPLMGRKWPLHHFLIEREEWPLIKARILRSKVRRCDLVSR